MDVGLLNLWVQIPLASILVFVMVQFLKHLREVNKDNMDTLKEINTANTLAVKEMHAQTLSFISSQAETNREFLTAQRIQMSEGMARLAEEIKETKISIAAEFGKFSVAIDGMSSVEE